MRLSFFRHCETDFFPKFFYCSSHQFLILQQNGCSKNPKASPLLYFSALCDLPETSKNFEKKSEIFFSIFSFWRAFFVSSCRKSGFRFRVFLSLRYGADLGRSRLVFPNSAKFPPSSSPSTSLDYFSYLVAQLAGRHEVVGSNPG